MLTVDVTSGTVQAAFIFYILLALLLVLYTVEPRSIVFQGDGEKKR